MFRSMIQGRVRGRVVAAAAVLYGLAAVPMFVWPGLVARVSDRCDDLPPLDVRGYWTAADARDLVRSCGAAGRSAYVHLQVLDIVYPAVTGVMLLLVTALLSRRYGRRGRLLLVPAVLAAVLDYAENIGVWTLLLRWPQVDVAVATIGGPVTAVKRLAGFVAFTIPILLGLAELARRRRLPRLRFRREADSRRRQA